MPFKLLDEMGGAVGVKTGVGDGGAVANGATVSSSELGVRDTDGVLAGLRRGLGLGISLRLSMGVSSGMIMEIGSGLGVGVGVLPTAFLKTSVMAFAMFYMT